MDTLERTIADYIILQAKTRELVEMSDYNLKRILGGNRERYTIDSTLSQLRRVRLERAQIERQLDMIEVLENMISKLEPTKEL